jgi:peptide/nickel transport system permease protein
MGAYILQRCFYAVLTLFGVSVVAFGLLHLLAGDPAALLLGPFATEESIQHLHEKLRLDDPLWAQYFGFISNLFKGELISINYNQPVFSLLLERFPATVELTIASLLIAGVVSTVSGIVSAIKRDTVFDYSTSTLSLFGISMPDFWLGTMLILLFGVLLHWFPAFGRGPIPFSEAFVLLINEGDFRGFVTFLHHLSLPALTLSAHVIGVITRVTRTSMLEEVNKEYVMVLRSKGLSEWLVVIKHMFRNSLLPVLTIFSMQFVKLLGGAVIVETVFGWPGVGFLMVDAIYARDYPLVQAGIIFFSLFFIVVNLLVDLLYTYLDPRIKY